MTAFPGNVWSNPRIVDAATARLFSAEECDAIARVTADLDAVAGHEWIGHRIVQCVKELNDEIFRFAIEGSEDPVRVSRRRAGADTGCPLRSDLCDQHPRRKLSFTVLLSDPEAFEGGHVTFAAGPLAAERERGAVTIFPAFVVYEITPVTRGERVALTGFALGPTFA